MIRSGVGCALLLALAVAAGCGNEKRSLVPVDIEAGTVTGIGSVNVYVRQGGADVEAKQIAWDRPPGEVLKVGIYLPAAVSGTVTVEATALDVTGYIIGASDKVDVAVSPGKEAGVVTLRLNKVAGGGADGGVTDAAGPTPDGAPAPDMAVVPPTDGPGAEGGAADAGVDVSVGLTWKPAENLENDVTSASRWPSAAIDGKGNALVAWTESNEVRVRRYDVDMKTWAAAVVVERTGSIDEVAIKMAPDGHATVMWTQNFNQVPMGQGGVWSSHSRDSGKTWTPPKQVHLGYVFGEIELVVAHDGDARAAWEEIPPSPNMRTLWSAHYDDGTGMWSDVAAVRQGEDTNYRYQKIAMDSRGNGLLTWVQNDSMGEYSTWVTSFQGGQPLKVPQVLDTLTTGRVDDPAVAMMVDGSRGIVIWGQVGTPGADLMFSDWTPAGGFAAPARILNNPQWTGAHAVAIDHLGVVTAVWTQPIASGRSNLVALRRPAGQPWGNDVVPLESSNQAPPETDKYPYAELGVDGAGNVHAAWHRKMLAPEADNTYGAVVRRFAMGKWEAEVIVGSKPRLRAFYPSIAVSTGGKAVVAWWYGDPHQTGDKDTFNAFAALFQ